MKILLQYRTELGARTIVCEGGDANTAKAIAEAHRSNGLEAHTLEDQGRYDMKAHFRRMKIRAARVPKGENIVPIKQSNRRAK